MIWRSFSCLLMKFVETSSILTVLWLLGAFDILINMCLYDCYLPGMIYDSTLCDYLGTSVLAKSSTCWGKKVHPRPAAGAPIFWSFYSILHWCLVLWSFIFRSLVWTGNLILKTPFYTLNKWYRQAVSQNFDNFEYISFSDLWEDCALIDCVFPKELGL